MMNKKVYRILLNVGFALAVMLLVNSCAQQSSVTHAPHRTKASSMQMATVVSSYPIRVTKNSGLGGMAGSLGGAAIGYNNIGSGTGRLIGGIAGQLIGAFSGRAVESKIRETNAQEVTIRVNNRTHTLISKNLPPLRKGDTVMAFTNVYGTPLNIKPVR
jgi:outer membrane lipoprotein SlyB